MADAAALSALDFTPSVDARVFEEVSRQGRFLSDPYTFPSNKRSFARLGQDRSPEPKVNNEGEQGKLGWLSILEQLVSLRELGPGWDSYAARPIRLQAQLAAFRLVVEWIDGSIPTPTVVPMPTGGVALEWHVGGMDLEIEVEGESSIGFLWSVDATGEEFDGELPGARDELAGFIRRLATHD